MAKLDQQEQHMTMRPVSAVSYYLDKDSFLPGMIRPHTYKGWHAYWRATATNGQSMVTCTVGPYNTREDALSALYQSHEETIKHKQSVKDAYDKD